jgi:hypothetical protein
MPLPNRMEMRVQVVVVGNYAHAFVLGTARTHAQAWRNALLNLRSFAKKAQHS